MIFWGDCNIGTWVSQHSIRHRRCRLQGPLLGLDLTWAIGALLRCGAGKTDLCGLCGLAWGWRGLWCDWKCVQHPPAKSPRPIAGYHRYIGSGAVPAPGDLLQLRGLLRDSKLLAVLLCQDPRSSICLRCFLCALAWTSRPTGRFGRLETTSSSNRLGSIRTSLLAPFVFSPYSLRMSFTRSLKRPFTSFPRSNGIGR